MSNDQAVPRLAVNTGCSHWTKPGSNGASPLISVSAGEVSVKGDWRSRLSAMLIVIFAVAAGACGFPKDVEIAAAFVQENPTFTVTGVSSGEGDGSTVYRHIRYRRPSSAVECEVVWGYQEAARTWRVFHKGEAGLAGTVCESCARRPCA